MTQSEQPKMEENDQENQKGQTKNKESSSPIDAKGQTKNKENSSPIDANGQTKNKESHSHPIDTVSYTNLQPNKNTQYLIR